MTVDDLNWFKENMKCKMFKRYLDDYWWLVMSWDKSIGLRWFLNHFEAKKYYTIIMRHQNPVHEFSGQKVETHSSIFTIKNWNRRLTSQGYFGNFIVYRAPT